MRSRRRGVRLAGERARSALPGCALALTVFICLLAPSSASAAAPPELWSACNDSALVAEDGSPIPPALVGQRCEIPRGIAADPERGHVFVADQANRRILDFNPLGQLIRAWGWDVVEGGGTGFEICVPEEGDECEAGTAGGGAGQFGSASPQGVAVDSAGNVYVVDRGLPSNQRVQKFDRKGNFLLMFGGEVNKTKVDEGTASEEEENICPFDPGDVCQAGTTGTGNGQFGEWPVTGDWIAVDRDETATDADDSVYVGDAGRIQRFDTGGAYQDEIPTSGKTVKSLSVDPAGNLYYSTGAGIGVEPDVFKLNSSGVGVCTMQVQRPNGIAADTLGTVYAINAGVPGTPTVPLEVVQFDSSSCAETDRWQPKGFGLNSTGIAANLCAGSEAPGNLYLTDWGTQDLLRAYGSDPIGCFRARTLPADPVAETTAFLNGTVNSKGEAVEECGFQYGTTATYGQGEPCEEYESGGTWVPLISPAELGTGTTPIPVRSSIGGLTAATTYHFRLTAKIGGEVEPGADDSFKTLGPPTISEEHVVSATDSEATLRALANPEGLPTECHFEYGQTPPSYGQSTAKQQIGSDRAEHTLTAVVSGLKAGTTYHWRAVCDNTAVQDGGLTEDADRELHTYRPFATDPPCPNQAFRTGASAFLPDCRAYEMVSPLDKNGGDILSFGGTTRAVADGGKLVYQANPSFGDAQNSWLGNQYIATRTPSSWPNHGIHPPVAGDKAISFQGPLGILADTLAHTPDLCSTWFRDYLTPSYTPEGQEDFQDLYRRDNCGAGEGELEALTPDPPALGAGTGELYVDSGSIQGVSDDGTLAIFAAKAQLPHAPEAAPGNHSQIYVRHCATAAEEICGPGHSEPGEVKLVSVLPGGTASGAGSVVGAGPTLSQQGAVSRDGEYVYWTSGPTAAIYLRIHPEQGIVPEECATAKACTVAVSAGTDAFFWAAASDGSAAIYSEGGELWEFDLAREEAEEDPRRLIAAGVGGVAGASEDLKRVYFVSTEKLPGAGENSEEEEAIEGEPNLYLYEAGEGGGEPSYAFVATLGAGDVQIEGTPYNPAGKDLHLRTTRVSPDGQRFLFLSRAPLTDFDNTDALSGKADVEVFAYQAGGELLCISCNPAGARPRGREFTYPYWKTAPAGHGVFAAAWIPAPDALYASRLISTDGERILFNSNDALLPRDANGTMDVYQWQAPGKGGCKATGPTYFPQNGGCLDLISAGQSSFESQLWEADADGSDVFFSTESSLVAPDTGLVDLYDARIGGGFEYPVPPPICEGEACQSPPGAPEFPAPASGSYRGPGKAAGPKPCAKGRRKVKRHGKTRCLKPRRGRAHPGRGAGR